MASIFGRMRPKRRSTIRPSGTIRPTGTSKPQPRSLPNSELRERRVALQELASRQWTESEHRATCYLIGQRVLQNSRSMESPNFSVTTTHDLQFMAESYDQHFFGGHCLSIARHYGMQFRWSKRMTSTGGKTVRTTHTDRRTGTQKSYYEIVLSTPLLFQTFGDLQRPIRVTGLVCTNRLQAMQRILEHEMIHLVEMLVWEDSCCASSRFQSIAKSLFGHTEHKHDLITQQERAAQKFNVRLGTKVVFQFEGTKVTGTVNRITRRATVLVPDTTGQLYDDGKRYRKYYVPLSHLRPAPA